ncbi:MAG TPA: nucleotidyltransferase domain-containing protein [Candidatus Limnocylindria bacterium]|nr:nucleotidyltransferase domain-containing protein [Candidatus Limnocylindria bacterium]
MSLDVQALDALLERFANACRADDRIVAGLLYGSHAAGTADAHSDVDLVAVAAIGHRDDVWADREVLVRALGDPLQVEDFDDHDTVFFILADGTDGELTVTDARGVPQSSRGPHRAIHDPDGMLAGVTFTGSQPDEDDQVEQLRRCVQWFWHDMAHFIAAMGRGQSWWAAGQLDALRGYCVNLARLRADFAGHLDEFDKLDTAVPAADLAPLASTYVPLDHGRMLVAARTMADYYREVVADLAAAHGIPYPTELEAVMRARLDSLEP